MRFYLDTNILVFMLTGHLESVCPEVLDLVTDYTSRVYTSGVCVHELVHLQQIGKLEMRSRAKKEPRAVDILEWLRSNGIGVKFVEERHIKAFSGLPILGDHRDPFDRLIIAQAIADRIPLVSSDRKFAFYSSFGLDFILNER